MTIIVTEHAIDRFAERVIGTDPSSLTRAERIMIHGAIFKAVMNADANKGSWSVCTRKATYVIANGVVRTVLPALDAMRPCNRRKFTRIATTVHP